MDNGDEKKHELSLLVHDYVEHLEIERGRSPRTAENYLHYLEMFEQFAAIDEVKDITSELVRKYRLWLNRHENDRGETLSLLSQNYHLIALRGFLRYLSFRDIPSLIHDKIVLPKVVRKQDTFLHYDEITRLI